MLETASGSLPSYPGHPPAAYGGLVSLVPDLNSWPSEGARLRRAAVAWSKRYDPLLRHEVEGVDGLDSLGYQVRAPGPQIDERRTRNMTRVAKGQSAARRGGGVNVCVLKYKNPAARARGILVSAAPRSRAERDHYTR